MFVVPACKLDTFILGGNGSGDDGGTGDDSGMHDAAIHDAHVPIDAAPDACIPLPETCNGLDDDCDGVPDEPFTDASGHYTVDPANCGACGTRCDEPNTAGTCMDDGSGNGVCNYVCLPGFVDTDNNVADGCEYFCTPTAVDDSVCDLADNDCDGLIDEDVNLATDLNNCGSCGTQCTALHATPTCTDPDGDGHGTCGQGACDCDPVNGPCFADVNPGVPGCEYQCPVVPVQAGETCNGIDDDCDGNVDELPIPGLGGACFPPSYTVAGALPACGGGLPAAECRCDAGAQTCSFGVPGCTGFGTPLPDDSQCNGIDDDCDGNIDEEVNKTSDTRHCGSCLSCDQQFPNAHNEIWSCSASACHVADCLQGFIDLDGDPSNGCEYSCTPTGAEQCDGVDNDCNGQIDDGLTPPANFCHTLGTCAGTQPACQADLCTGQVAWSCPYTNGTELDACGNLALTEAVCDGQDGNCNGQNDESFSTLGQGCHDNGQGVCERTGSEICSADHTTVACNLTSPVVNPTAETCNGKDDDCDGVVDNNATDTMVTITRADTTTFQIDKYEASHPDATSTFTGSMTARACSNPGVLPWFNVDETDAAAACAAAGKHLCTEADWQLSCGGLAGLNYPYGNPYQPTFCNGRDVDLDCTAPDTDDLSVTGSGFQCPTHGASQCVSPGGVDDMSGNLEEWTQTAVGTSFRVKGGAFDTIQQGLTCKFSFIAFTPDTTFPNLGFRCCK